MQSQPEYIPSMNCLTTDLDALNERLGAIAGRLDFRIRVLGSVEGGELILLTRDCRAGVPNVLVIAGVHGEEPGGPWSIIAALERLPEDLYERAHVSFLPVLNPYGFRRHYRENASGLNVNRGLAHVGLGSPLSAEGRVFELHLPELRRLASDSFLALHEDCEERQFYCYTFEPGAAASGRSAGLVDVGRRHFEIKPDSELDGGQIRSGVIFGQCDGSFEDLMFHCGSTFTACTETPGLEPIESRIACGIDLIERVVMDAIAAAGQG